MYEMMSTLLEYPDTAVYEDERTLIAIKLALYLESGGVARREMTTRYLQYLVNLHAMINNFTEAGMTQMEQVNCLQWTDDVLPAVDAFPQETERDRKERLYHSAVSFFQQGEDCRFLFCSFFRFPETHSPFFFLCTSSQGSAPSSTCIASLITIVSMCLIMIN